MHGLPPAERSVLELLIKVKAHALPQFDVISYHLLKKMIRVEAIILAMMLLKMEDRDLCTFSVLRVSIELNVLIVTTN